MKRLTLLSALAFLLFGAAPAAQATASPILNLDLHHNPTNFVPGGAAVPLSTSTATEGSAPSTDEVQSFVRGPATSGNFKLTFNGNTTPNLPSDATASQIESALRALPTIGSPNVDVTATDVNEQIVATVTFTGALAATDVPQIVASQGSPRLAIEPEYWLDIVNVGPDPTTPAPLTLTVTLPSGITRHSVHFLGTTFSSSGNWSCPGSPGDSTLTCTTSSPIPRHTVDFRVQIAVNVSSGLAAGSVRTARATVSGGGAPVAPPAAGCAGPPWNAPSAGACAAEPTLIEVDPAPFGIVSDSFTPGFFAADGITPELQAGAHPDLLTVPIDFNSVDAPRPESSNGDSPAGKRESGSVRNLRVDTPPGFVGAPTAVGECPQSQFVFGACPASSQVGRIDALFAGVAVSEPEIITTAVFNMAPTRGTISDLAFVINGNPVHIRASLDPANNYAITTHVPDVNESLPPFHTKLTLWGVPADSSHDSERCAQFRGGVAVASNTDLDCPTDAPLKPFLTAPFECGVDKSWRLHDYDSWQHTGVFGPDITYTMPGQFSGCDQVPFAPSVSVAPTTDAADSPSGLDVGIDLPQHDTCDPGPPVDCGIATSPLKDATVTLPEGITVNPASANGLDACTPAQISLGTDDPVKCPDAARIADVQVDTVLPDPVGGTVFLATPYDNPFNSLLAGYIVLSQPETGLLVKLPGKITLDKDTGQLTGTFKDNPQLPFSKFNLHFKAGAHSSLITPKTCGDYTTNADFAPWTGTADVQPSDSFSITHGANGANCPAGAAERPFGPSYDAGPVSPVSGSFSPFTLRVARQDGEQEIISQQGHLPQGLLAKLAGVPACSDAQIAQAQARSNSGDGAAEQADPSCPTASKIGTTNAAAGAGPSPYWAQGNIYLAGPYKGAPVSLVFITPAVAGPFDLGNIVVRDPLYVDPTTAQAHDEAHLPTMLDGIPLDIRDVRVNIDRPDFIHTGTSCDPTTIGADIGGAGASLLSPSDDILTLVSEPYQLSDCGRLGFKPNFKFSLKGGTKRNGHPAFKTTITYPTGDYANLSYAQVVLPKQIQLDQSHIQAPCTRPQFAANQCPDASIIGTATASSPLIDYPLTGPVYLRTGSNPLPDVVLALHGPPSQPIEIDQVGKVDTQNARLRTTFETIPDAPISSAVVSLLGGSKGLLVNNSDLCAGPDIASLRLVAHDGDFIHLNPKVTVAGCPKAKKHKHRAHKRHHTRHHRRAAR